MNTTRHAQLNNCFPRTHCCILLPALTKSSSTVPICGSDAVLERKDVISRSLGKSRQHNEGPDQRVYAECAVCHSSLLLITNSVPPSLRSASQSALSSPIFFLFQLSRECESNNGIQGHEQELQRMHALSAPHSYGYTQWQTHPHFRYPLEHGLPCILHTLQSTRPIHTFIIW